MTIDEKMVHEREKAKATFPHDNIAICNTEVIAEQLKAGGENVQKK